MMSSIDTIHPLYAERLQRRHNSSHPELWDVLDVVCDPELPGISLWDLGVLQDISVQDKQINVTITLTYSGCPAVDVMKVDIKQCLTENYPDYQTDVTIVLSPAWSTDMMSPEATSKLKSISIAAPSITDLVVCPKCDSEQTSLISQHGSTACKALYRCDDCLETFDYFKSF